MRMLGDQSLTVSACSQLPFLTQSQNGYSFKQQQFHTQETPQSQQQMEADSCAATCPAFGTDTTDSCQCRRKPKHGKKGRSSDNEMTNPILNVFQNGMVQFDTMKWAFLHKHHQLLCRHLGCRSSRRGRCCWLLVISLRQVQCPVPQEIRSANRDKGTTTGNALVLCFLCWRILTRADFPSCLTSQPSFFPPEEQSWLLGIP